MAWTSPTVLTFAANTALTAAQLNTYLRDNLNATEIGVAETPGSMVVSTAANVLQEMTPGADSLTQAGTRASNTYGNLTSTNAGVGPTVTVTTGNTALVLWSCQAYNLTSGAMARMGIAVSGATTIAAADTISLSHAKANPSGVIVQTFEQYGQAFLYGPDSGTALTAGVNTFTAQYKSDATPTTACFQVRRLMVIPF